jgi:TolA-binding protein
MRIHLLGLVLMAGVAMPLAAQSSRQQPIEKRVQTLEEQLRAVQRRVFPNGNVEPEISSAAPVGVQPGLPATSPVADLTSRVDALEAQLAALTGQAEANENRLRRMEESISLLRDSVGARLDVLERGPAQEPAPSGATTTGSALSSSKPATTKPAAIRPAPVSPARSDSASSATTARTPATNAAQPASATTVDASDAEESYNDGFHLWEQKKYDEAIASLEATAARYPQSKWASWAKNLAGRSYLDKGRYASAARAFLANYQDNPRGERAADSLFFLGESLLKLNKPADACKAYDELQDVYGQTMRDWLKQRLPAARTAARCR